jgi:hypothetical protein
LRHLRRRSTIVIMARSSPASAAPLAAVGSLVRPAVERRWRALGRAALLASLLLLLMMAMARRAVAGPPGPIDRSAIPEPLRPWAAWALDGKEDQGCGQLLGRADTTRCAWPSRLELTLDEHGGRFTQAWHVDVARDAGRWVPLPGDGKRWPSDVKLDGKPAVVLSHGDGPSVEMHAGDHVVSGSFAWDSVPESLHVPPETGLLTLALRGAPVPWPNRDAQGTVWLQKDTSKDASGEGNALEIVVHRKVADDVPVVLTTRVELHVAGKKREELLGKALPAGFVPMALEGPLPARVEADGRLRVQVRPGIYTLQLQARSEGPVRTLARPAPDGPWREGEEVWVFEARNDYRVVTLSGVPSIDPQQTTLPDAWKALPAYPMKVGDVLSLDEKRRGDADPPPNQLTLVRTLWLDFDGSGYTVSDQLSGTLERDSRLTMAPPTLLGRVSVGGRDQFITHLDDASPIGVEVRQGTLAVTADSRISGGASDIPAVGWAHDFHQVTGSLHLPPGWKLLHASGVDEVPGTWVKHWSLLELFLALIVAIGVARLYGLRWGWVALAMLLLTLPEDDAPKWSWLAVLAIEGLLRVLPPGRVAKLFEGARLAALVVVAIITVPFLVQNVREGIYPALARDASAVGAESGDGISGGLEEDSLKVDRGGGAAVGAAPPAPPAAQAVAPAEPAASANAQDDKELPNAKPEAPPAKVAREPSTTLAPSALDYRQSNSQVYDPTAVVQTGPGLPHWQWTTLDLRWSGPVASTQRLHLYLLSPLVNLVLALLRAALLVIVLLRMMPWTHGLFPRLFRRGWAAAAVLPLVAALIGTGLLSPRAAFADVPDKATLDELATRLTRRPDCTPDCASLSRMALDLRDGRLVIRTEVDAASATAVPLPGAVGDWSPARVALDGKPAGALLRTDDGVLWIEVPAGHHQVALDGPMPDREIVPLALHVKPHRVDVASAGWTVRGVHEDGLADDDLELARIRSSATEDAGSMQGGALPPFVRVERTLRAGLDWQVDTRVTRATPPGAAVVVEVPLLPGESVTTADVRVEGGKALVHLAPQSNEAAWHSVLAQKSPVTLVAPASLAWIEVWRVDVGPVWHASFSGIPFVHTQPVADVRIPEWHPWPGEQVSVDLVRPDGVAGQTLTIDESTTEIQPGLRATDVTLTLHLRSSRGGEHTVKLPPGAQLESLAINGATQPIRQQGDAVTVPVVPGAQTIALVWRETPGLSTVFGAPAIDLGAPSVNAATTIAVPGDVWLLMAGGPRVGPAVLFWSLLLVLLVVSLVLGANRWTPLRWWHWLLLSIGLSQVSVEAGAVFVGWLLVLGWRGREPGRGLGRRTFNLVQVGIVLWTLVALGVLGVSLYQGLLGAPEMQVRGNGSSADMLRWFTDRAPGLLPAPWVISVPMLVYRAAMLAWALWIALALLRWLRWAWEAFTAGEGWRKKPPAPPPPMAQPPFAPPPVPVPPSPMEPQ